MAAALAPGRLQSLRALSRRLREPQPREMAEESVFRDLLEILTSASRAIEQSSEDPRGLADLDTCLLLVAECFRCLRNACVECARNQHLMRNLGLISTSVHLIKLLHGLQIKEELLLTALRCSLQFLGNIAAGNGESQNSLWKCAFPDLFLMCLAHSDEKIVAYCCMVLFTCLDSGKVRDLLHPASLAVALHVVRVYREQLEPEWSFLIVTDHLLKCPELVKALYAKLSNQERVTLLELLMATLSEQSSVPCQEEKVFERHAEFLAGCFQEKCGAVLKLTAATDAEDEEALVTIRLLDVLCEMTSNPGQLQHLQALPGLLETAIVKYLWGQNPPQPTDSDSSNGDEEQQPSDFMSELYTLRLTHLAGKQAVNVFTTTHAVTGQEEISHPAVGFKSHLIRLIGNLCYKNKENQDKVYELDGIPLILDNCSIDDNNPCYLQSIPLTLWICSCLLVCGDFLKEMQPFPEISDGIVADGYFVVNQWAVFAIRNLTEHNERNQELIAGLEEQGLAESSALESMGLEMEKQEGRVVLRSARKKPS